MISSLKQSRKLFIVILLMLLTVALKIEKISPSEKININRQTENNKILDVHKNKENSMFTNK